MKKSVIGILAHVDAGKTTLAEALLYTCGKIRKQGRVDSGNTVMDTDIIEKERGITVFSSQAVFNAGQTEIYLLDTPGHVDFSAETERTLNVLDYAILVISGLDGVQAHTKTLWKLLDAYNIPTFIFVTKMDFNRYTHRELIDNITSELGMGCVDFSAEDINSREELAECSELLLEEYISKGSVSHESICAAILSRDVFPCYFGSGLKADGIEQFAGALDKYTVSKSYPSEFGAMVYKINRDDNGEKQTLLKVTGGELKVKDSISLGESTRKVAQLRIYNGAKYAVTDTVEAGAICAVTGLDFTLAGMGLGYEERGEEPKLEPVMCYRVLPPKGVDAQSLMPKLRVIEEEEPLIRVSWQQQLQEIQVQLMGEIQAEILKSVLSERYKLDVSLDSGRVLYKETVEAEVEGVGHFEPLRHYAEVHILIEPLPRGSGVEYATHLSENVLDGNWQRLILTNLREKQHLGVLTGSPLTDVRLTLVGGRAHLKHTEGGDFRQATYRSVRQGLMQAKSILLEPYYSFVLDVPTANSGRAITDIKLMGGTLSAPENRGEFVLIEGKCPVVTMNGYPREVASYSGGRGKIQLFPGGYDLCHNEQEVIKELAYEPCGDIENTPDSVFCSHGAGFNVSWDRVPEYMHVESCIKSAAPVASAYTGRKFSIDEKELDAIMAREFGVPKYDIYRPKKPAKPITQPEQIELPQRKSYLIVDGYNVIFAFSELKELAAVNLENARSRLMELLCNYAAFTETEVILVFDAYNTEAAGERRFNYNNIHVAFTKENELADVYIEKLIAEIGKNHRVRIVTSDNLIRLTAVQYGVLRVNASSFEQELQAVEREISEFIDSSKNRT